MTRSLVLALLGWLLSATCAHAAAVEIVLIDRLDEPRGFCLDIVGSQAKATPARGLQAHSCYSYQGRVAVDQGFDPERLKQGEFRIPAFGVCMETSRLVVGAGLDLKACSDSAAQRFQWTDEGRIVPFARRDLCLTVDADASRPGGGGYPTHLIRPLTLQRCEPALDNFQKWRIREKAD